MSDIIEQPSNDHVLDRDLVIRDFDGNVRIRLDHETGSIFIHNSAGDIAFQFEMPGSNLRFGGHGRDGDLVIFNRGTTSLNDPNEAIFHLDSQRGVARIGGNRVGGQLICLDTLDQQTIFLDGTTGEMTLGANNQDGNLFIQNGENEVVIRLNGAEGAVRIGGANQGGELFLRNNDGANVIHVNGAGGTEGGVAIIAAGSRGSNSSLNLFSASVPNQQDIEQAEVHLGASGSFGFLSLGGLGAGAGVPGLLSISGNIGTTTMQMRGDDCTIRVGGSGQGGNLLLFPSGEGPSGSFNEATITLRADSAQVRIGAEGATNGSLVIFDQVMNDSIRLGARGVARFGGASEGDGDLGDLGEGNGSGHVFLRNLSNETTIHLDGEAGDIILQNGDGAEDFEIAQGVESAPGTVMVLDVAGKLRPSTEPYDKRVAGIVAGGGDLKPGIVLGRRNGAVDRVPIALFGRTYCKVDARTAPIAVGDLLTSASLPGSAMKATSPEAAFGAIVGKALRPLATGTGLIPILVSLQ
jgi:hypothetical protein